MTTVTRMSVMTAAIESELAMVAETATEIESAGTVVETEERPMGTRN
jgi:hypothetical protein